MLKLLIADDEYLVLDSLKLIVTKNIKDVAVVGTASTGREAIEKAIELKPDIVFMDIHMPGIDGIEAIRQIKAVNSEIVFVILTAYDFFDYAKEAINLGVSEYLLKPISKNKVIETINSLCEAIAQKRRKLQGELELKERISRLVPCIEGQFISYFLYNSGSVGDISFYEDIFKMSIRKGYAVTALLEQSEGGFKEDSIKLSLDKQSLYDFFRFELKRQCPCLIGDPLLDRISAFIPVEAEAIDGYEARNASIQLANRLMEKAKLSSKIKFKIGIGRSYDLVNINKSFNEAYMAASLPSDQSVMHFEDINPSNTSQDSYPMHLEGMFANKILTGNLRGAREVFKEIFMWLANNYREDIDKIKSKLIDMQFVIEKSLPFELGHFAKSKQENIMRILKASKYEELEGLFLQYLSDLAFEVENQRKSEIDGIIPNVLSYLDKNYDKNITLDSAAKSVNLSYHYFSKIFKDEVGKSFVDYLTELRIEKSMRFLENSNLSIKEVCHNIGYNDPNYYCKIFKKVTGMTPTEYRSSIYNTR